MNGPSASPRAALSGAMTDPFGRTISYLRVSVTDRCDLRCFYCMVSFGYTDVPIAELKPDRLIHHMRDLPAAAISLMTASSATTG